MSFKVTESKRKRGGYMVEINTKLPDGRPYRERRTLMLSKADCERWAKKREAELMLNGVRKEEVRKEKTPTFAEFGRQYLTERAEAGAEAKKSYQRVMRSMFDVHLVPAFGALELAAIDFSKIEKFKLAMKVPKKDGEMRGDKAINNVLTFLGTMLRNAVDKKLIAAIPKIVLLKKDKKAQRKKTIKADGIKCYTADQVATLVAAAQRIDPSTYLMTLVGCDAGLRLGEIMALSWNDIDLDRGFLTVNRSIWCYEGEIWEDVPKSGASREIPMTPELKQALDSFGQRRQGYILADEAGHPVKERKLRQMLRTAQRAAGLVETGRLHVLRHSFCSVLASRGAPVRYIQQLAGHANISTTERYLHSDTAGERNAIALLDRAVTAQ